MRDVRRHRAALLIGQSFQVLYPSADEYRAPRRAHGAHPQCQGPLRRRPHHEARATARCFWCHVTGRALNREAPHEAGIWTFEDLSARRPVKAELTAREREVAAPAARRPDLQGDRQGAGISHRTVEIYRARLMRKYKASTTADLVHKLMAGG